MVQDVKKLLILPALVMALQMDVVSSRAEAQAAQKMAVLDLVAIERKSLAGKSITAQFRAYSKAFRKEADVQHKRLQAARNELRLQRSLLSPEAMQIRERKFRDEVAAVQRRFQARQKALAKSRVEAFKLFKKNLAAVLKKLRAERKIDVILTIRPSVLYVDPRLNITGEVLKRMNARLKKIAVTTPEK